MNFLPTVLSNSPTKDKNILELRNYIANHKVKFLDEPTCIKDNGINPVSYYLNALPLIPKNRDIYNKQFNICEIKINWPHLLGIESDIDPQNIDELIKSLKTQYHVSILVCDKDYTKVKFVNQECILIIYDDKDKLKQDLEFYTKCFKTIDEQNKEREDNKKSKLRQIKNLTSNVIYKDWANLS